MEREGFRAGIEMIQTPEVERIGHYQIIQAERLYGTEQGMLQNASILIGPDGRIVEIKRTDEMERDRRERESQDTSFRPIVHRHEVVMPALTDAHNHPLVFGEFYAMMPAFVFGVSSEKQLAESLRAQLADRSGLQLAVGWDTSTLPNITRETLDEIRSEPTVLMDMSYHGSCANTAALRLIEEHIKQYGLEGQLTGYMKHNGHLAEEYALMGFEALEQQIEIGQFTASAEAYLTEMYRGGAAYTHDMIMVTPKQLEVFEGLSDKAKAAIRTLHVNPRLLRWMVSQGLDASGYRLKLFADGSNNSRTALYYEPYLGTDHRRGIEYHHQEEAQAAMELAAEQGISQLATHAIGNRGIDNAIGFSKAWKQACEGHGVDGQARIEHMSVPHPGSIRRAAELGLSVSPQPNFIPDIIPFSDRFGKDRLRGMVPLRRMLDSGLRVMIGTDGMPNNMLLALHCALDAPHESQRISLSEAIHTATATAPEYEKANRGSIKVGQPADLLLTTNRLIDQLTGSYGLYESTPATYSGKMDEIAGDLSQEVRGVMRQGENLLPPTE